MYQNKLAASEKSVEAYGTALAKQANEKTQLQYRYDELKTENTKLKDDVSKLEEYAKDCEKATNQAQNKNSLTAYSAALEEETRQKTELQASRDEMVEGMRQVQTEFSKLKEHVKNCEKATQKAQKEAKDAKGFADHRINSQKGQLKNAERNWDKVSRELRVWTDKYGTVDKPAEEKLALQQSITDLQSKAEEARNQITVLETQIRGTPEQMGLHQALEQWEEHKGCSKEFMELEDKLHDVEKREQKLESDLTASKEKYQNAKADIKSLQTHLGQVTQDQDKTNYIQRILQLESDLRASAERNQKTQLDLKAVQEVANQLVLAQGILQHQEKMDVNMSDDDMLDKAKLESYLKAFQDQHQQTESDMNALKAKAAQLEQANKAFQDNDKTRNDSLEKLQSDLQAAEASHQATKSNIEVLQEEADQLKRDLGTTKEEHQKSKSKMEALQEKAKEQHQKSKSKMEALQEKAKTLESDLKNASGNYQTMKSNMEELQVKADAQESDLKTAKTDLGTAKHEHQMVKSELEELQGKANGLQESNKLSQKKQKELYEGMEKYRRLYEASQKAGQDKSRDHEMADVKEDEVELLQQQAGSSKPEHDMKTQQKQVSSAAHTTSIDLFLSRIARTSFSC